ncbi:MAG TPA: DNA polymerase I, partial [Clostridiaceae bacterium]|nr:DNA polymerase I [Clostridiaceae bacterium]
MSNGKLMIIDGNSILNRAFYAIQGRTLLSTSDGLYTNAVFGFLNILFKYLEEEKPDYLCVAFDLKAPTFRHKEYEEYKAKRKGMPEELAVQVPVIKDVLDAMNIKRLEYEGYEADDILGSVSLCAEEKGMEVVIVTGDRDSLQLASDRTRIKIPVTRGGRTETDEYNYDTVIEKFGVTPLQLIDVKGLMGDQSDNIPGVPGIGEKTALSLIKEFGSIENLYDNLDSVGKKSVREKLAANREQALLSKKLAAIERNMPELCSIEELRIGQFDEERLYELFKRLEFRSFIEKLNLSKGAGNSKEGLQLKNFRCIEKIEELTELKSDIVSSGEFSIYYLIDKFENFAEKLVGVAITYNSNNNVYIDINSRIGEEDFLKEFSGIFENPGIKKTGHDVKNFITYLKRKNIEFNGLTFDSMIAAYIIDPSRNSYTVSELSESYLNVPVESLERLAGKGKSFTPYGSMPCETISVIAAQHSEMVIRLKEVFERIIRENGQEELYYKIELPLVEVLADMEYWGFKVNIDGLREFSLELEEKINAITEEIYDMAGE